MNAPVLRWKLGDLLTGERVSVYRLNRELAEAGRTVSRTTLYRLAHAQPERIDLEVAGRVLWGLGRITGKHYKVGDLLEYEVPAAPPPDDDDDRVWLDNDLSRLGEIEPYEWGEGELEAWDTVRYVPGQGLVVVHD